MTDSDRQTVAENCWLCGEPGDLITALGGVKVHFDCLKGQELVRPKQAGQVIAEHAAALRELKATP
jgi:hypothetical protein